MRLLEEMAVPEASRRTPEIICIGGGKGGVGKTCLSVNLAIEIARKGWRVILFDADLSCSNVETVMGIQTRAKLDDFFHQKGAKNLARIVCETQYENLRFVPGTTGLLDVANPRYQQKTALIRELKALDADLVVVDLDAGAHLNTLDFFLMTEANGILVVAPEKTSIDNAFKFLRAALFRKIERFYQSPEVGLLLKRNERLSDFLDTVGRSELFDEEVRKQICGEIVSLVRSVKPRIVVNRVRNAYEAQIAANIFTKLARQELMVEVNNLGYLYFDKCVPEAVNSGTPFIVSHPKLKISACVADIANRLGYV
ncbi:MAG TPA: AAA family ATPase [Candidatus Hydrogenedentes bacterium]|nr:AAA family ATPase [Candidatus Hydrogenedentota bacterium]HOS03729.1 AAA family ATPase [Candidatus Hydrogenedentota bacterium]